MIELAGAIAGWLVAAAALGVGTGWLLWGWWAHRPPSQLPTDEELRELRADLASARTQVAELRAAVATWRARAEQTCPGVQSDTADTAAGEAEGAERFGANASAAGAGTDSGADSGGSHDRAEAAPPGRSNGEHGGGRRPERASPPARPETPYTEGVLVPRRASLRDISGIGPKLEQALHRRGLRSLTQLASLSDAEIDELDASLGEFRGRVRREDWVGQARGLLRGP